MAGFNQMIRDNLNAAVFVAAHRVLKLMHAFDAPEADDAFFHQGARIEMSHDYSTRETIEPDDGLKEGGGKVKWLKPKEAPEPDKKALDDLAVETTPDELEAKLNETLKESIKQEDKLAYAKQYHGYTEEELEGMLARALEKDKKLEVELKQRNEGYNTPERIEERIKELQVEQTQLEESYAQARSAGADTAEIKTALVAVQKKQFAEAHKLKAANGEVYRAPEDSTEQFAEKVTESAEKVKLATAALEALKERKKAAEEQGQDPSGMLSEVAAKACPMTLHGQVADLAVRAASGFKGLVTGEQQDSGPRRDYAEVANRMAKITKQDVLAQRMVESSSRTIVFAGSSSTIDTSTYVISGSKNIAEKTARFL